MKKGDVVGVTVTYGARWHFLSLCLDSFKQSGVGRVIVVNNGSEEDILRLCAEKYECYVEVVELARNFGSARAFSEGIKTALSGKPDFLLLVDDDNILLPGSLAALETAFENLTRDAGRDLTAVVGYRPAHIGVPASGPGAVHRDSFLGFHLPSKIKAGFRRLSRKCPPMTASPIRLLAAPYGGLLVPTALIGRIGLPREDFVLYGDDTEYTFRINCNGGNLYSIREAPIHDMESSWNILNTKRNSFKKLLLQGSDFRVYYMIRNQIFFETKVRPHSAVSRKINKAIYISCLVFYAILLRRRARLRLILEAVADGEHGRLGENPAFPLPAGQF